MRYDRLIVVTGQKKFQPFAVPAMLNRIKFKLKKKEKKKT